MSGIVGNMATGAILKHTGSWPLVWITTIGFYIVGAVVYLAWAKGHVVFV